MAEVYDADPGDFRRWSPLLWEPMGVALVDAASPARGERVVDACCGAGGSAIPAARAVGPGGVVDAVDLNASLVELRRSDVRRQALSQLNLQVGDVLSWRPVRPYDVVLCEYGASFFADPDAAGKHLVSLLRPGGRLAVSVWQQGSMELVGHVYDAVRGERPDAVRPEHSDCWLDSDDLLRSWLARAGLAAIEVRPVRHRVALTPELSWAFVTGTGLRGLLAPLDDTAVCRVRDRFIDALEHGHGWTLVADSLIGTASRPDGAGLRGRSRRAWRQSGCAP
jgi:SAM-dependent methyltransferase